MSQCFNQVNIIGVETPLFVLLAKNYFSKSSKSAGWEGTYHNAQSTCLAKCLVLFNTCVAVNI